MNALRLLPPRVWAWPLLLLLAGWCLPPAQAAEPPPAGAAGRSGPDFHIYRPRHISAVEAARVLNELFNSPNRREDRARIIADPRTNSLLISAAADDQTKIEAVLTKIDVEGSAQGTEAPELRVFALKHCEPDAGLEAALWMLVGEPGGSTRFVLDRARRQVLIYGDRNTLDLVEALLTRLEDAAATAPGPAAAGLEVRLFWVVSGPGRDDGGRAPDDLREAAADLARLGIDRPRLAALLSVSTTPGAPFETAGLASLDRPYRLALSGTVSEAKEATGVEFDITVSRAEAAKGAGDVCRLRTHVTAPLDRPVVLGAAPAEALKSAFVVQVERRKPAAPPAPPKKASAFEFREAPWSRVLEWLADQTGMPFVGSSARPTGTFTFIPPRPDQRYSVAEIIDILNDALLGQKVLLLRREHSLTLIPADEKVDPAWVPRIGPDELERRGRTELVSLVVPLQSASADEVAPEVKKMLGPFGEVVVLKRANELVLQDTAGNLRQVFKVLADLDRGARK